MLTRIHITVLLILAAVIWAGALMLLGLPVTWEYTKPFALTVSILSAACVFFDRWLWKWPIFKGWLVSQPNLHGTWKVTLKSSWVDPATGQTIAPIECVMVIRQTFSSLSGRLFTKESSSFFVAHKIVRQNDGVFQLFSIYQNTPDVALRGQRSEIHYGALLLEVRGEPPVALSGHYWTDRATKGSFDLTNRVSKLLNSYQDGVKAFRLPSD